MLVQIFVEPYYQTRTNSAKIDGYGLPKYYHKVSADEKARTPAILFFLALYY